MTMVDHPYVIPGFRGFSRLENRAPNQFKTLENWTVRTTSLQKRKGSTVQIDVLAAQPERLYVYRKKNGAKHLITADGLNLRTANSGLTAWNSPLKSDCNNAKFGFATIFDNCYMGNGHDMLKFDGTALTAMTSPPEFDQVISYNGRLLSNNLDNPTFFCYSDAGDADTLDETHYWRVANDSGDPIKKFIPLLSRLLIVNKYSTYSLYGSNPTEWEVVYSGPTGTVSGRSVVKIGETVYWLSHTNVVKYSGSSILPVNLDLGDLSTFINMSYAQNSVGIAYDDYYWLAVPKHGSTTNDMVLLYDTLSGAWSVFVFPFAIYDFVVDDDILYCLASDKKLYKLNTGTTDAGTAITGVIETDAMHLDVPGRKKRIKVINFELADTAAGGKLNVYLQLNDGAYQTTPFEVNIPTSDPGRPVPLKVSTKKFYFITMKIVTTADATINNWAFGAKVAQKVK